MLKIVRDALRARRKRRLYHTNDNTDDNGDGGKTIFSRIKCVIRHRQLSEPLPCLDLCQVTSSQPRSRLCHLPPEILQMIAAFLPPHTQMALSLTCKTVLASVDLLWPHAFREASESTKCGVLWLMAAELPSLVPYMGPRGDERARPRSGWWGMVRTAPVTFGQAEIDQLYLSLRDVLVMAAYQRLASACNIPHLMRAKAAPVAPVWDENERPVATRIGFRLVNEALLMRVELEMKLPRKYASLFSPRQQYCVQATHCWHDENYEEELIVRLLLKDAEDLVASQVVQDSVSEIRSPVYRCRYCPTEIQYAIQVNWLELDTYSLSMTSWRDLGSGRHDRSKAWIALQNTSPKAPKTYEPCVWRPGALNEAYDSPNGSWSTQHMQLPVLQSLESQSNDPPSMDRLLSGGTIGAFTS